MQQAPVPTQSGSSSIKALLLASVLLPPLGLVLLWRRGDIETGKKAFGSLGIVILSAVYVFLIFGPGLFVGGGPGEDHYAELERHRAAQHEAPAQAQPSTGGAEQNAATANANSAVDAGAIAPAPSAVTPTVK